jgi:hypothetical protein
VKRLSKILALVIAVVLIGAAGVLAFAQPLLSSRAHAVTASLNGAPIQAELLRPPALPGTYYVHLPDAQPRRYSWFGIAFSRQSVFSPVALYKGWRGLTFIHTDQAKGVCLTDGKIEDHWKVDFTSSGVQFSNGSLSVTLTRL